VLIDGSWLLCRDLLLVRAGAPAVLLSDPARAEPLAAEARLWTDDALVARADHGALRVLTMNRPAARNALNRELIRSLYAALKSADSDESVRAVVLTGADRCRPTTSSSSRTWR
jgi:hypothetical protein